MSLKKLFLTLSLLLLIGVWGACVDVPTGSVSNPNPDYRSMVRFVNGIPGGAAGNVTVDGAALGSIAYQAATGYLDLPSGSRSMSFGGTAQTVPIGSEQQSTIVVYGAGLKFLNLVEGHKDKNNADPLNARVKFINLAEGSAANLFFVRPTATADTNLSGNIAFESPAQYRTIVPGNYLITGESNGTFVAATLSGASEVPPVTSNSSGSASVTMDTAGITYKVDVLADNSQGFYTAAHFHNAPAGANGSVVKAIDVTAQVMSFPSTKLAGTNEVPADTSKSTGFGTFSMTRTTLTYSIDFTMAGTDTFTAAHFHAGAAGTNGPVIFNIATTKFASTTKSGTWPMTAGLIDSVIRGLVYVNAHSQLYPGGVVRAQLRVDAATANSFSGTWSDTTFKRLRPEFNNGNMYVNFHTTANPGGQIRGQLIPTAQYGVATLPAATYEAGKMYTIIATGKGSNFSLVKLTDRQFGVAKPVLGVPDLLQRPQTSK